MKKIIGAQGEITIIQIDALPAMQTKPVERNTKGWIISHSKSGHHHLLTGGDVMERVDVPTGMQKLYAILDKPASLIQDAAVPHGGYDLPAGIFEFRIAREFDPFAEEARRVAD
ncbi:hypothetical protein [Sphingomonas sp. BE137]|uniref:hypothetical protein n=1 Tax=Sphingomonas sp. BE137 TaxID=2817844 RepID=UPI001AE6430D|nr:hypothetical protein [Sphingomonas sp. BE137]MDR6850163.1 hypothetical protein [Sphingomonas sp. BE137]